MSWFAAIPALVGTAAQIAGGNSAARAASTAARDKNAMIDEIKRLMPDISDLEIELLLPQVVGEYTPESLQKYDLGPSAMEGVSADTDIKLKQLQALAGISDIAEGGLTDADMAASRQIQREVNQNNKARQDQILMEMAQRGTLGSGAELASRMNAGQQAADAQAAASDNLIQQAQARSLQALMQQGNMAGSIRQQDVGEQSDIARARDAINDFNTRNAQNVANQNVGERNTAQQRNLAAQQAIANAGVDLQNQRQMYNKNLKVDDYERQKELMNLRMGVRRDVASAEQGRAANTAGGIGQIGQGITAAISSFNTPNSNNNSNNLQEKLKLYQSLSKNQIA